MRFLGLLLLVATYAFIIGPAAMVIVDSFNAAPGFPSPFDRFTIHWYTDILAHDEFLTAMRISALVGFAAALVATVIAVPAAYALTRDALPMRDTLATLFMSPLLVPQIVIGLAVLQVANLAAFDIGFTGLIAVHAVFVLPFILRLTPVCAGTVRFPPGGCRDQPGRQPLADVVARHAAADPRWADRRHHLRLHHVVREPAALAVPHQSANGNIAGADVRLHGDAARSAAGGGGIADRAAGGRHHLAARACLPAADRRLTMPDLVLDSIVKRYRGVAAVDNLSLRVHEGELMCLLGPSGCGKTSTLRIIAGFETIEQGRVCLGEEDITAVPAQKRDIGIVFQSYALFSHLTVEQNVGFGLKMRGRPRREIADAVRECLRLVQLENVGARLPRQLSGGPAAARCARARAGDPAATAAAR